MTDVLEIIKGLRERMWNRYGDVLQKPLDQDEVHHTYYIGELLLRRGMKWEPGKNGEGAMYPEGAIQAAFTAGRRIGKAEAQEIAEEIVSERLSDAREALLRA